MVYQRVYHLAIVPQNNRFFQFIKIRNIQFDVYYCLFKHQWIRPKVNIEVSLVSFRQFLIGIFMSPNKIIYVFEWCVSIIRKFHIICWKQTHFSHFLTALKFFFENIDVGSQTNRLNDFQVFLIIEIHERSHPTLIKTIII